jgi:hypothetical protein
MEQIMNKVPRDIYGIGTPKSSYSLSEENYLLSWNLKIHDSTHNSPPVDPILS